MPIFEPRRPHGLRDPNDGWVSGSAGRFWGKGGAAGLLAYDPARGVLLQHRVAWSDQGGTWGLPGGARHVGEDAITGALREAHEEAGVPGESLQLRFTYTFDVGYWSYTTVGTEVSSPFEAVIGDPESEELRWVPLDDVTDLPLHPGFGGSWPQLRDRLERPPMLVVDAANVVGSRPDGWWRDRAGAAERLLEGLRRTADSGAPADWFGLDRTWALWPRTVVVLEGQARRATHAGDGRIEVVNAARDGDQAIVDAVSELAGRDVVVVTADRALRARVEALGARTLGPQSLLDAISP